MNWETTEGGLDYTVAQYPWDEMVKEEEYEHFTTFRKYYTGGGWYMITVPKWELEKMRGKVKPKRIKDGHRLSPEAKRKMRGKRR